ncbi:ATP-dependent endonuclease [Caulobacter segnis]|uniref:Chromosome segregation protein SMC n=1 Tax=Caulobacter segnis TaxID=88688 RepID=A0A2W5UWK7_9CAUL|nr:AAA family ATPase [Caulobacter segnis]PZR32129.1 MAG: chromosome segregation protein SMC [Caulobacter segnis]
MKIRSVKISNVRSFLEQQTLLVDGEIAILVGPNGGGKTNLLDTIIIAIKRYLMPPAYIRQIPQPHDPYYHDFTYNDQLNNTPLDRYSGSEGEPQEVEIAFEVTTQDIANIAMIKADAKRLVKAEKRNVHGSRSEGAADWDLSILNAGDVVSLRIENGNVFARAPGEHLFLNYLQAYEADNSLRRLSGMQELRETLLYLPVNRTAQDVSAEVVLANVNASDLKRQSDAMTSKHPSSISNRAIATIAQSHRRLEQTHGAGALDKLKAEPNMTRLTKALTALGYEWSVECINPDNNTYTILLEKQGSAFRIGSASSGERQLLTYLLAIYALDVRDALILIDEPELHLHPRWQKALLNLFEQLSVETGNQFIMATHSPTFISPTSVQYVSRVFSENQRSRIVRLERRGLPGTKHRFDAINSQNNERIFFADLVVLVEGPSDRMVMERMLAAREAKESAGGATVEVVAVHGKMMFSHYSALLKACGVRTILVADFDYVQQIGNDEIKSMLGVNTKKIKEAIGDPSSFDGATIVAMIDDTIAQGKWVGSTEEWKRIKSVRTKLRPDLSPEDMAKITKFIDGKRADDIYVLKEGTLEAYLPSGYGGKDIDKLIALINEPDFEERLPEPHRRELFEIADAIEKARQNIAARTVVAKIGETVGDTVAVLG